MRAIAAMLLGYYPLPASEASRIRNALAFPAEPVTALDPCAGTGAALTEITSGANVVRLGIELDSLRAEQARSLLNQVIHGDAIQTRCPSGSVSLLYLNPPYGGDLADYQRERMELTFLEHTYQWVKPEGILILVIPQEQLCVCAQVLSFHFRDVRVFRLTAEDSVRYYQVVVFAVRRSRGRKANAPASEVLQVERELRALAFGDGAQLPALPDISDFKYPVPPADAVKLTYEGLPLDEIEDLLLKSSAYRQVGRILFGRQEAVIGQPLIPLHSGHVGLLAISGLLNGIFGQGKHRHVACWVNLKLVDREEEEDSSGRKTVREKERFAHRLALAFADGRTAILS